MAVQTTSSAAHDRSGLDAVVRIVARVGGGQEVFLGTGTVVARRHVVTCRHVVVEHDPFGQTLGVLRQDLGVGLASGECLAVEATRVEPSLDLAILTMAEAVDVDEPVFVTRITRDTEPRLRAQSFAAYGYRQAHDAPELWDHELSHLALLSSYRRGMNTMAQLQLSGGLPAGTSGGPVLLTRLGKAFFLGTVYLGGERSATSRLIMADDVLGFLSAAGIKGIAQIDADVLFRRLAPTPKRRRMARLAAIVLGVTGAASLAAATIDWPTVHREDALRAEFDHAEKVDGPILPIQSIAVLPFSGSGEDPVLRDLAMGTTDSLAAALSKLSHLFVIDSDAVLSVASEASSPVRIAQTLGIRYVISGSIQPSGKRLRMSAQLIDARTGEEIWAAARVGELATIFDIQNRLVRDIVSALEIELSPTEKAAISQPETTSMTAYRLFVRGLDLLRRDVPGATPDAIKYLARAVEIDPGYGRAHAGLVRAFLKSAEDRSYGELGLASAADARIEAGMRLGDALEHRTASALSLSAVVHLAHQRYSKALAAAEQALALSPNEPEAHVALARTLIFSGRPDEALPHIQRAMRLNPRISVTVTETAVQATSSAPADYLETLGLARLGMGRFEAAASLFERALEQDPDAVGAAALLCAAYAQLGDLDAARVALDRLVAGRSAQLGRRPTLADESKSWPYKNPADRARLIDGLRAAGLG